MGPGLVVLALRLLALVVVLNLGGAADDGRLDLDGLADKLGVEGKLIGRLDILGHWLLGEHPRLGRDGERSQGADEVEGGDVGFGLNFFKRQALIVGETIEQFQHNHAVGRDVEFIPALLAERSTLLAGNFGEYAFDVGAAR